MLDNVIWAVLAANAVLFLITWAVLWHQGRKWRKLKRRFPQLFSSRSSAENGGLLEQLMADSQSLKDWQEGAERRLQMLEAAVSKAPRHLGLVRYNAFQDAGGQFSFSLALLDDEGDGLLLTNIYHRGEGLLYAKPIKNRQSSYPLTPEEEQAIQSAWNRKS